MPSFAVNQHDALAKSTVQRKHLNLLLHDYSEENKRVYGSTMPTAGSLLRPVRPTETLGSRKLMSASGGIMTDDQATSRQMAAQVNNKRTPTGQFFTTINPTLYERQAPPATYDGTNILQEAVTTMRRGSGAGTAALQGASSSRGGYGYDYADVQGQQAGTDAYSPGATGSAMQGKGTTGSGSSREQPWLLPWQTGDRKLGRAMADAVRHGRTPIGAFANLDLAKANK